MGTVTTSQKVGQVTVIVGEVDWNNLAWSTLLKLGAEGDSPGSEISIVGCALSVLRKVSQLGTIYANPAYTVTAPSPTPEFLRGAEQARVEWLKQMKQVLSSSR